MRCEQCLRIVEATSERISMRDEWRYKHHAKVKAFRDSAEAGCQLCLMFWYQLPDEVRIAILEKCSDHITGDEVHGGASTVTYTIDEYLRDRGRYEVSLRIGTTVSPTDLRVYFVRAEG